jgi:membrane protein
MRTVIPLVRNMLSRYREDDISLSLFFCCVFLLLYRMTPNRRLTWHEAMPGSAFASVGWIVSSLLFSFYVNNFGHCTKTYGSLGGIIALLVWLYLGSLTVLLGGELNAALARKR